MQWRVSPGCVYTYNDSCSCHSETNAALALANYTQQKNKLKKMGQKLIARTRRSVWQRNLYKKTRNLLLYKTKNHKEKPQQQNDHHHDRSTSNRFALFPVLKEISPLLQDLLRECRARQKILLANSQVLHPIK